MIPTEELEDYPRPSKRRRIIAWSLGGLLLGVLLFVGLRPVPQEEEEFPEFSLELLNGEGTLTSDELRGSPVVVNFFASWCAPCREEAPLLEQMWQRYRDEGVRFVGIDVQDTEANARLFIERFDITYPVVRDPDQEVARALDLFGLPQTFFVQEDWTYSVGRGEKLGSQGSTTVLGALSKEELEEGIQALLGDVP